MNTGTQNRLNALGFYLLIYVFSYFYIAYYHQNINLFKVNIHESGALNFTQVLFYSSHFLAHLPVHIVIALTFVGSLKLLGGKGFVFSKPNWILLLVLFLFLGVTLLHSFIVHGTSDTLEYILQKKQGHDIYGEGGSWKLHLVSTISMPFFIPVYVWAVLAFLNVPLRFNKKAWIYFVLAVLFIPGFNYLCEGNFFTDIKYAFTNNRYLAHSVREIITFPLTYFPLFFIVFYSMKNLGWPQKTNFDKQIKRVVFFSFGIFMLLFAYQVILPLLEGIGNLSQKPEFTKGNELPLVYLITSHYFEHFLDTIFFVLFSAWLFKLNFKKTK